MASTLMLESPDDVHSALQAAGYTQQRLSDEARQHYAGVLYARRVLSLEQAARLAGMSLWKFIPFLSEQNLPVADYDPEEIEAELETVRWLTRSETK